MAQVLIRKHRRTGYGTAEGAGGGRTKVAGTKASRHSCRGREAIAARGSERTRSLSCAHSAYSPHACGRRDSRNQGQRMTVVVDASVALEWFVKEENTPLAVALLASGERAIAPTLIVAELCNAAWRLWRRSEMARAQVSV